MLSLLRLLQSPSTYVNDNNIGGCSSYEKTKVERDVPVNESRTRTVPSFELVANMVDPDAYLVVQISRIGPSWSFDTVYCTLVAPLLTLMDHNRTLWSRIIFPCAIPADPVTICNVSPSPVSLSLYSDVTQTEFS